MTSKKFEQNIWNVRGYENDKLFKNILISCS